jgi:D-glycero-alpha-D-manno-heptose-7-phosphate kinase
MRITSIAPTRIGLVGGGTDVDPFALEFGGRVLSIGIDLYVKTILVPQIDKQITVEAFNEKRIFKTNRKKLRYGKDPKFDLVRAIIHQFNNEVPSGFTMKIQMKAESALGLGSSGAAAVSMIGALNYWLEKGMSRLEIAILAFLLETEELGWRGGIQDQIAAAFGGINIIPIGFGEDIGAIPVALDESAIKELRRWMMIIDIGGWRHSKDQQESLVKGMGVKRKQGALLKLRRSVDKAKTVIEKKNWIYLGKLLDDTWKKKKRSNPAVTSQIIDDYYETSKKLGMLGGKVMGSGGAGHLLMLVPPKKQKALSQVLIGKGAKVVDYNFDFTGLKISERK